MGWLFQSMVVEKIKERIAQPDFGSSPPERADDVIGIVPSYSGKVGYIVEYED